LRVDASQPTTASTMSISMPHPFCTCTPPPSHLGCFASVPHSPHPHPTLPLQLLLEFLEETPVSALSDELLRAALDHSDLVEAQGIEAHTILRIVFTPLIVGDLLHGLEGNVVVLGVAFVHEEAGDPLRLSGTHV